MNKREKEEKKKETLRLFNEQRRARLKMLLGDKVVFGEPIVDRKVERQRIRKEKRRQSQRNYYQRHKDDPAYMDRRRDQQKQYLQRNKEKVINDKARYRSAHREEINAYMARYRATHPRKRGQ